MREKERESRKEVRKGSKGENKNEWLEKIEKKGCGCERENKWTDRKICGGERDRESVRERWRFSWELAYFTNECIRMPSCVTFILWNKKKKTLSPNRYNADWMF